MSIAALVSQYGYLAVALGCILEGETVLLMAGFAAHRGLLDLPAVLVVAWLSSFAGDQFWFVAGRRHGAALVARFAGVQRVLPRVQRLIRTHQDALVLGVRFMVGVRVAGPILMGWSGVPAPRFLVLNLLGAALWTAVVGGGGYFFGQLLERVLPDLRRVEEGVIVVVVLGGLVVHGLRLWRRRRG